MLNWLLVPVNCSDTADKPKKQVPKAVEKVLAGSIRREMALEEFCAKQTTEKNASDLVTERTETVRQDFKLSPEASPGSYMTIPESQGTPLFTQ
ncbi:hypothetical protein KIW84_061548 [Lathyrus oleraceus]|uniref:Uncharacterized protein n=1 Tax=Pisum sativum TaxID=3888 RepID=A0A9D4W2S3_PEA|nr:hypothetical protein KIW84_061548 [Pisum sativum]